MTQAHPMRTTRLLAALGLAGALALVATPAAAAETTPTPDPAKAENVCARVPQVQQRVDNTLTRLKADSGTKGSIAWLRAQARQAEADGKDAAAAAYRRRADLRSDRIALLVERKADLAEAETWCTNEGYLP